MSFFRSDFWKSAVGTLICAACLPAFALRLDVKEGEVLLGDRRACHAFAEAWSKGEEFNHAARFINVPKSPRPVRLRGFGDFPGGVTDGYWIGQLKAKDGEKFDLIEVQSMGTCFDVNIVLAKKIGGHGANAFQAVVRPGTEVNDEFRSSAEGAYNALRWGSSYGISEKLFQLNGHLYKASGSFVDLRPHSRGAGRTNSNQRSLGLLFKRKKDKWLPICSFEGTLAMFRSRESHPICKALSQGNFNEDRSLSDEGVFELSGANSELSALKATGGSYDSSRGCGASYGWLYADEEFSGKTREQVLKDGIPKSLTLNNAPTIGSHARGVLEVLYERYQGRVSVIGTVSNDDPWPDFADRNLRVLDVNSAKVILRTANLYPFNKWNYDLEILQNHKSGPFATCRGQMLKQVKVKYWYQP